MNSCTTILHLIGRLDGYGGARMLRYLACRQAARGASVRIAALAADGRIIRELQEAGVDVQTMHSRGPWDVVAQARLVRIAARANADLIHTWGARPLALSALAGRQRLAPPCVATLGWADARRSWTSRVLKRTRRRVACLAIADEPTSAWLAEQGVDGVSPQTIPTGVPAPEHLMRDLANVLSEPALVADGPLIAVVGPLVRPKQLDEAIWHFELVRVLYPEARLLVVGDGPDRTRLERIADQVSEPGCVRFLGFRDDLDQLWPHVDVYWQLAASPATPWALLEAMAAGVPIVAADVPAHRAAITPDKTGCLVPLADRADVTRATDRLLGDRKLAKQMGLAATSAAAQWPLDAALDSYESIYKRALAPLAASRS